MTILNLTQHKPTPEQVTAGVVELCPEDVSRLVDLLTVNYGDDINEKVRGIVKLAEGYGFVMIGGAPFLMPSLDSALRIEGVTPLYAFSERESFEEIIDGKTIKRSVFKHKGFYTADGLFK